MDDLDKIIRQLDDESIEKRLAAAIVLGELHVKRAQEPLLRLMESEVPVLQRHAILALTRIGLLKKHASKLFPFLTAHVADVREAARLGVVSLGEEIVPAIRERMAGAAPDERRALEAVLADLGGKDAFATLLNGFASADGEAARNAAIAMRARVKGAGARERRGYLAETEKFLAKQTSPNVIAAALKIMGYLEDEKATETLLAYASNADHPPSVRQEALIALRFAIGQSKGEAKGDEKAVVTALLDAADADDRTLAQTALHTLGSMQLPAGTGKRVEKLAMHPDFERARFVIEMLGRQTDSEATRVLVHTACTLERKRAEIAATALTGREDAVGAVAKALLETTDVDRAWLLKGILRPSARKIAAPVRKQLLDAALDRLGDGARGWEALLEVVREADADGVATALRALAHKLRKAKHDDRAASVLGLLSRSDRATDDDRYALASLELTRGSKDTRAAVRAADEALKLIGTLASRGFDIGSALRKDKTLELDALYYVGFHFAELKKPLGEELLEEVVKKAGRTKVGKMAKNKLALLQGAATTADAD